MSSGSKKDFWDGEFAVEFFVEKFDQYLRNSEVFRQWNKMDPKPYFKNSEEETRKILNLLLVSKEEIEEAILEAIRMMKMRVFK